MRYARADLDLKRQALSQVFPDALAPPRAAAYSSMAPISWGGYEGCEQTFAKCPPAGSRGRTLRATSKPDRRSGIARSARERSFILRKRG
jgi:hypothetical protein